ncbi:hypothetical protein PIB30_016478 [Stylosanthes scabra]|uniref:Uncharacterized protein n=1 Tax=Stylosanthes scabra TaxID=79078 RepID=A0ABU6Y4B3_9FABA|nr:hypothetical protein [Stylosanthes scabra]
MQRQERRASGGGGELRPSVTGVEEDNGELVSRVDGTPASFRSEVEKATAARSGARVGDRDDGKFWSSALEWETATAQARRQEGDEPTTRGWRQWRRIFNFAGIRGRGRGFPARVSAIVSGGLCPPSPSPRGKFPAHGAPFRAFPAGIPAAWGFLTGLVRTSLELAENAGQWSLMMKGMEEG